jgi:Caspase domain
MACVFTTLDLVNMSNPPIRRAFRIRFSHSSREGELARILTALSVLFNLLAAAGTLPAADSAPANEPPLKGRYALLVGVTKYLGRNGQDDLEGPGNDTELMRNLLTNSRFGFPNDDEHVRVLSETAGQTNADRLPTQRNIEREFARLADRNLIKPGYQVVILLAGHGSQQPADWSRPGNFEPDGLDELFMPRDVGFYDKQKHRFPQAIIDDDFHDWVDKIVATGAQIWFILDSCHSGTGLRGERAREIDPKREIDAAELEAARAEGARRAAAAGWNSDGGLEFIPESPKVAAIFAAQPTETTPELPQGKDGKVYGLLTYSICEILDGPGRVGLTYFQLVNRIQGRYSALGRNGPTPLPEGSLCGDIVCGFAKQLPPRPPIRLLRDGQRLYVDAGRLFGLTTDSILAVYGPDAEPKSAEAAGYVRVKEAHVENADIEPVEFAGIKPNKFLPRHGLCQVVTLMTEDLRLPLTVAPFTGDGKDLSADERKRLAAALKGITEGKEAPLAFREKAQPGVWLLQKRTPASAELDLVSPDQARQVALGPSPDALRTMRKTADKIAKTENLVRLVDYWKRTEESDLDANAVRVSFDMYRLDADGKETQIKRGIREEVKDGDSLRLEFANHGKSPVDVSLLLVTAEFGVRSVWPNDSGTDNRIPPGAMPFRLKFRVTADKPGIDRWILVAVRAEELTLRSQFLYLEQSDLESAQRALSEEKSRGPTLSLDKLLLAAGFPGSRAGNRGDVNSVGSSCSLDLLEYRSVPRPP